MDSVLNCKHLRDNYADRCPIGCCYMLFFNEDNNGLEETKGYASVEPQKRWDVSLAVEGSHLMYESCMGLYFLDDGPAWYLDLAGVTGEQTQRYGNEAE